LTDMWLTDRPSICFAAAVQGRAEPRGPAQPRALLHRARLHPLDRPRVAAVHCARR